MTGRREQRTSRTRLAGNCSSLPSKRDGEYVIRKDSDDGFHQTELPSLLAAHAVRHLAVCGVMSEMCVSATARSALNLDYHVVLPHDSHATYDIPAVKGLAHMVPHAMVSRVAEWALGDQIDIIAHAADVRFESLSREPAPSSLRQQPDASD